jgi:hypothetical protein
MPPLVGVCLDSLEKMGYLEKNSCNRRKPRIQSESWGCLAFAVGAGWFGDCERGPGCHILYAFFLGL